MLSMINNKHVFLFMLLAMLLFESCQTFPDVSIEKDGKRYGVTHGLFQGEWWDYYERALSFAEGGFWKEAEHDLREAISLRKDDQRQARTYGLLNFIDYFPHRELGIILYREKQYNEAENELIMSGLTEKSARTEFYLDRVRKAQIKGQDHHSPEIKSLSPESPFLTNAFSVVIKGIATDDNFIRYIKVGNKDVRIDLSEKEITFATEIPLIPGKNIIPVQATDLLGKTFSKDVTINVDRRGPVISIKEVSYIDPAYQRNVTLIGYIFDDSGLTELMINEEPFPPYGSKSFQIQKNVTLQAGKNEVTIEVKDGAGNTTTAILIPSNKKETAEQPVLLAQNIAFEREFFSEAMKTDIWLAQNDTNPPEIHLRELKDEQITYLQQAVIEGCIEDNTGIAFLNVNGETFFEAKKEKDYKPSTRIWFKEKIGLREGDNIFTFWYSDLFGNTDTKNIKIKYEKPRVYRLESRLRLSISDFEKNTDSYLFKNFELELFKIMERGERFFISLLSQNSCKNDLEASKKREFRGILSGSVTHVTNDGVEIWAKVIDAESGEEITSVSVYDENVVDIFKRKELSTEIDMKLTDELPLLEGKIIEVRKNEIDVNMGKETKIKKGMRYIVYQIEDTLTPDIVRIVEKDFKELGYGTIKKVLEKKSVSVLDESTEREVIFPELCIITL